MAQFPAAWSWLLPLETSLGQLVPNPDPIEPGDGDSEAVAAAKRGAQALAGINSWWYPADFARIVALPAAQRGPAIQAFYEANFCALLKGAT